ncbi:hypothetical protein Nos7107_0635 [Nostoc sp. PCC 7107]|nr:hypothetical protein Nos7107_0635 [Nostoc sp. PCC 7107]
MLIDAVTKTHCQIVLNHNSKSIVQGSSGKSKYLALHHYPLRRISIIFSEYFYLPAILDSGF